MRFLEVIFRSSVNLGSWSRFSKLMNRLFSDAWDESLTDTITKLQAIGPTGGPINRENYNELHKHILDTRGMTTFPALSDAETTTLLIIVCHFLHSMHWLWKFSPWGDERTAMDSFHHVGQQRQWHGPEPKLGIQILNSRISPTSIQDSTGRRPIFKHLVSLWVLFWTTKQTEYTHKDHKVQKFES